MADIITTTDDLSVKMIEALPVGSTLTVNKWVVIERLTLHKWGIRVAGKDGSATTRSAATIYLTANNMVKQAKKAGLAS